MEYILRLHPGDVADRINWILREAREDPAPALIINADELVIEYHDLTKGSKIVERICRVVKNIS